MLDDSGNLVRLSEYNPTYGPYLDGQRKEMAKNYLVTILTHPKFAKAIIEKDKEAIALWQEFVKRPRNEEHLKKMIEDSHWWGAAYRFDYITDW